MTTLTVAARNAACDAIVGLIDAGAGAGTLEFQTTGSVVVATLTFSNPAFGASANGVATASPITDDSSAIGGTTTKAVMKDSNGAEVLTATVGTINSDINMTSVTIAVTEVVSVSSLTVTVPA